MRAITIFVALLFLCCICTANDDVQALIEGEAARYGAVKSGRLQYLFESPTKRKGADGKELDRYPEFYSFDGTNWAHRWTEHDGVNAHFKGVYFEYSTSADKSSVKLSNVNHRPETLSDPPVFAGSFWHEETVAVVREHVKESKLVGSQNIDGVETKVCEMARTRGGKVRLCIAPQLGFVLPLVEFLDPEGYADVRFVASSFVEVKPGLWLPGSIKWGAPTNRTLPMKYYTFSLIKYEQINESIPDEDFVIPLKRGTRVYDNRPVGKAGSGVFAKSYLITEDGATTGDLIDAGGK